MDRVDPDAPLEMKIKKTKKGGGVPLTSFFFSCSNKIVFNRHILFFITEEKYRYRNIVLRQLINNIHSFNNLHKSI